jgi:hypothetical protein
MDVPLPLPLDPLPISPPSGPRPIRHRARVGRGSA